jgi:hypothetical protein
VHSISEKFSNKIRLKQSKFLNLLPSRSIQTFDESLAHDFVLSDEFLPITTDEVLPFIGKFLILNSFFYLFYIYLLIVYLV